MTRPRRPRARGRARECTEEQLDWLRGGEGGQWALAWEFLGGDTGPSPGELWAAHQSRVLDEHIAEYPGTRPLRWWQFSAPEPRRRLGGAGTPSHERLADALRLEFGVPVDWITSRTARTYRSMGLDLGVPALDPRDPPMYESEATYLDRLGLLLRGERRRLTTEDFELESVLDIFEFDPQELEPA